MQTEVVLRRKAWKHQKHRIFRSKRSLCIWVFDDSATGVMRYCRSYAHYLHGVPHTMLLLLVRKKEMSLASMFPLKNLGSLIPSLYGR
jgi:hypothetical protein